MVNYYRRRSSCIRNVLFDGDDLDGEIMTITWLILGIGLGMLLYPKCRDLYSYVRSTPPKKVLKTGTSASVASIWRNREYWAVFLAIFAFGVIMEHAAVTDKKTQVVNVQPAPPVVQEAPEKKV